MNPQDKDTYCVRFSLYILYRTEKTCDLRTVTYAEINILAMIIIDILYAHLLSLTTSLSILALLSGESLR